MSKGLCAVVAAGVAMLVAVAWATTAGAQTVAPPAPVASDGDAQVLRERAAAFWAARMTADFQTQWALLEPRGRGRMTPQEYAADRGSVRYVAYQVEDATVNGYFATVKVRLLLVPILPSGGRVPVQAIVADDRWVKVGGVWYRRLDDENRDQPQRREP